MHIRFLETVIWLSELKNFRATAGRMNMTPAAISGRILAIEQELGIRLFERDTREVRLTQEGATFVEGAREIVARYGRLVEAVTPAATVEGTVRIGLLPSMAFTLLPGIMEVLRHRFSRIRVAITTDSSSVLISRLENRELDVILGFAGPKKDNFDFLNLCTFGMYWVAAGATNVGDDVLTKHDIMHHPIICYENGTLNHQRLVEYLPESCFSDTIVHYSNSLGTMIGMVSAGVGIAVLPPIVIQNELRAGTLRVLNVKPAFPPTDYYAVFLKNPSSRLSPFIASVAYDVATRFCSLYDDALASQQRASPGGD